MGFLDHSTNNIILDAVLTDEGRKALASREFSVAKFALSDDEVNYNIIRKYGISIGREKIEKNTPIFEGLTNQAYAQKYKLVSCSNSNLVFFPKLNISSLGTYSLKKSDPTRLRTTVTVEQSLGEARDSSLLHNELTDFYFLIEMNNLFLQIPDKTYDFVDSSNRALYEVRTDDQRTAAGMSKVSFIVMINPSVSNDTFDIYGSPDIKTYIKVTGISSGTSVDIPVNISK
jgi:hypothetical protein